MTAWRQRHKKQSAAIEAEPVVATQAIGFSLPNIATIATGSLAATAVSSLLSNEPSQREVMEMIQKFMYAISYDLGRIAERVNQINDFNDALGDEFLFVKSKAKAITDRRVLIEKAQRRR